MVEFALVVPLLLLVLVGIFEFGRTFNYWIDSTHLANEAARWAVVDRSPDTSPSTPLATRLPTYVCLQASTGEMRNGLGVDVGFLHNGVATGAPIIGDAVKVTVTKTMSYPVVGGMLRILGGTGFGTIKLTGKSTMRIEQKPTTYAATVTTKTFSGGTCT